MTGKQNETAIKNAINTAKTIDQLSENLKNFIDFIFEGKYESNQISCEQVDNNSKPDLIVTCSNVKKYISVKTGNGNSVHQESLQSFVDYLREINIPEKTINDLKKFHYGDDTFDGTGTSRFSSKICKNKYAKEIQLVNCHFSKENKMREILNRFLFKGNVTNGNFVDVVYHGNVESGYWATSTEIIDYFIINPVNKNGIHFGPLTYQVWGRNHNLTAQHENRRNIMQIKWGGILEDLIKIRRRNL